MKLRLYNSLGLGASTLKTLYSSPGVDFKLMVLLMTELRQPQITETPNFINPIGERRVKQESSFYPVRNTYGAIVAKSGSELFMTVLIGLYYSAHLALYI